MAISSVMMGEVQFDKLNLAGTDSEAHRHQKILVTIFVAMAKSIVQQARSEMMVMF